MFNLYTRINYRIGLAVIKTRIFLIMIQPHTVISSIIISLAYIVCLQTHNYYVAALLQ